MMAPDRRTRAVNDNVDAEPAVDRAYNAGVYDDGSLGGDDAFLRLVTLAYSLPDRVLHGLSRARGIAKGFCRLFPC